MAKFAVYTIPPADSLLYQHGSELLGYDVRTGQFLPEDNATRAALPEFDTRWIEKPQTYGFHMTTGYSLYYDPADMPAIEAEMDIVVGCFGQDTHFELTPAADPIPFWHGNIVVLHYEPNPAMLMLHTMLTARINPYGTGSNVNPEQADPIRAMRVKHFHTPYMLDGWECHFSLMYPYAGSQSEAMKQALLELFPPEPLTVNSICLLVRDDDETHYRLHREYELARCHEQTDTATAVE
ncbi:MAG: hypothetical protein KC708_17960 [Anaerolineae bacterium]|nr:hypothetical protein [Anaerolineae bacterium]